MSYTAVYSPLYPADFEFDGQTNPYVAGVGRDSIKHGVDVTDLDGLRDAIKETIFDDADFEEVTRGDSYPKSVYKKLYGFKTWDFEEYNIERLGFYYDRDAAVAFWSTVSRYTEPFYLYTPSTSGGFPSAVDVIEPVDVEIMKVTADDGTLTLETYDFDSTLVDEEIVEGGEA